VLELAPKQGITSRKGKKKRVDDQRKEDYLSGVTKGTTQEKVIQGTCGFLFFPAGREEEMGQKISRRYKRGITREPIERTKVSTEKKKRFPIWYGLTSGTRN